jgi:hypothetical protein
MPVSTLPSDGQTITADAVAPAEPTTPPFSNTKEIVIQNLSNANRLFVRWGDPATETALTMTAANSTIVDTQSAITLAIGVEGDRSGVYTGGGVTNLNILFLAEANTCEVNITYVNYRGLNSPGGI